MPKAKRKTEPGLTPRKIRGIVMKSGASGVAASVVAAVLSTPGVLSGMIGTSDADNLAQRHRETEYGFPPVTPQLSAEEMRGIKSELASNDATLNAVVASTDAEIERLKDLAAHPHATHLTQAAYAAPGPDVYAELATLLGITQA